MFALGFMCELGGVWATYDTYQNQDVYGPSVNHRDTSCR